MREISVSPPTDVDQSHSIVKSSKVTRVTWHLGVWVESGFKVMDFTYWFSRYSWTSYSKLNVSCRVDSDLFPSIIYPVIISK